jgi:hypothetical protein
MAFQTEINSALTGDAALIALVPADRIYANRAPQQTPAPYLVWSVIDSDATTAHDDAESDEPLSEILISVSAYATSSEAAAAIQAAARAAIEGSGLTIDIAVPYRDGREDGTTFWRVDFDFIVWVSE